MRLCLLSEVKSTHFSSYICIRLAWMPAEINGWFFICSFPGLSHFRSKESSEASFHFMSLLYQKHLTSLKRIFWLCLSSQIISIKNILLTVSFFPFTNFHLNLELRKSHLIKTVKVYEPHLSSWINEEHSGPLNFIIISGYPQIGVKYGIPHLILCKS